MSFDGSLWGRRVQATGQTPVATATGFVALFTLDNFQGTRNEIVNGGANSALNGGGDIRVSTDDAGANQLPLEIVQFTVSATPSLQAIQFWVRFPTYEAASRAVWVFYNRAGQTQPPVTDTFGRNAVWQDDIEICLHCENPSDSVWLDSSGNHALTAQASAPILDQGVSSKIGNGVSSQTGGAWNSSGIITQNAGTDYTGRCFEFRQWIRLNSSADIPRWHAFFSKTNIDALQFNQVDIAISRLNNTDNFFVNGSGYSNSIGIGSISGLADGNFHLVEFIVDTNNNTAYYYVDGVLLDSVVNAQFSSLPPFSSSRNYRIFGGHDNGSISANRDEVVISFPSTARSANDVSLTYNNQNSPSTFWTMGEPEDTGGAGTITVTEGLKNVSYTPINPVVTLTGGILVNEQLNSVSYSGSNPTIVLTGVVSVVEQLKNIQYQANNPIIDLTGSVDIVENLSSINYSPINPSVTLTPSPIEITESLSEVSFVSRNPSILLTPEPIGIVSTVVFNGVLLDLSFDGDIKNTFFDGKIKGIEFNGSLSDLEFNGTITSKDVNGTIK